MATGTYGSGLWVAPLVLGHRPKSKAADMVVSVAVARGCVRARRRSIVDEIVVCRIVLELGS